MRDVEYLLHRNTYRYKALTPKAMSVFLEMLEMPENPGTITDAFLHADQATHPFMLARLRGSGLQTEAPVVAPPPPKPPEPPPVHLWTF